MADFNLEEDPLPPANLSNSELRPPAMNERGLVINGSYVIGLSDDPDNPKAPRIYKTVDRLGFIQYYNDVSDMLKSPHIRSNIRPNIRPRDIPVRRPINQDEMDALVSYVKFGTTRTVAKSFGTNMSLFDNLPAVATGMPIQVFANRRQQQALEARQQRPWWKVWGGKSRKGKTRKTRKSKSRKGKARKTRRR
jgi:hypothetical protein